MAGIRASGRVPHRLLAAAGCLMVAGCGGDKTSPSPVGTASAVAAKEAFAVPLGTRKAVVVKRFAEPLAAYAQPVSGRSPLDCLVYPGGGRGAYVRLCFRDGELQAVGTVIGDGALRPTAPAKAGRTRQLVPDRSKPGGSLEAQP